MSILRTPKTAELSNTIIPVIPKIYIRLLRTLCRSPPMGTRASNSLIKRSKRCLRNESKFLLVNLNLRTGLPPLIRTSHKRVRNSCSRNRISNTEWKGTRPPPFSKIRKRPSRCTSSKLTRTMPFLHKDPIITEIW